MAKVDPRDFLLNTDYELDKIVYFQEGSLNVGQYDIDIPHSLGFAPLIFGVCAFSEDFSDSRTIPWQYQNDNGVQQFTASANASNLRVTYTSDSGSPAKIYYRIYGFEPSDSHARVGATSKHAKKFILNTDYNYCKLHSKGITTPNSTVEHNLGYLPQILAWRETNGWVTPIEEAYSDSGATITSSDVVFHNPYLGIDKIHYRIYYDEA